MTPGDDADHRARLAASWIDNADAWTDAVRGGAIASRRTATDRAVVEAVLARRPRRVLDVGCGEGWLARTLADAGVTVVGVDGSPALVAAAERLGKGTFRVATYDDLTAGHLPLGDPFDVVAFNFALLADDHAPLLRALAAQLVPGGTVVIQTLHPWSAGGDAPYRDGWRTETFDAFGGCFPAPMPWYFRTFASWIDLLGRSGLVLTDLAEPVDPVAARPLALLLTAAPTTNAAHGY